MSHAPSPVGRYDELMSSAAVLRALPDGVVVCDRAGLVRFINPAAARLFQIDVDAYVGRPISELAGGITLHSDLGDEYEVVSASLRGGAPIMFGVIARDDHMEDHQTGHFIREGANLVGFRAELAEEALQQIG